MGQGVRRWMVLMNPRMLPMPVACVTARATVSLDVCGCVVVHAVIGIHMHHAVHSRVPVQVRCVRGTPDAVRSAARAAAKPLAGECPPARRFRTLPVHRGPSDLKISPRALAPLERRERPRDASALPLASPSGRACVLSRRPRLTDVAPGCCSPMSVILTPKPSYVRKRT